MVRLILSLALLACLFAPGARAQATADQLNKLSLEALTAPPPRPTGGYARAPHRWTPHRWAPRRSYRRYYRPAPRYHYRAAPHVWRPRYYHAVRPRYAAPHRYQYVRPHHWHARPHVHAPIRHPSAAHRPAVHRPRYY